MKNKEIKKAVKKRYAHYAQENTSCCPTCGCLEKNDITKHTEAIGYSQNELKSIPESADLGLGCGNPTALAELKKGEVVLDLGSGAGIDVFLAANKVGESGRVIGVDMTEEMIQRARKTAKDNGYKNVEFRLGEIEDLPVQDNTVDVIISNCVINLSPDKLQTFKEACACVPRHPAGPQGPVRRLTPGSALRRDRDRWRRRLFDRDLAGHLRRVCRPLRRRGHRPRTGGGPADRLPHLRRPDADPGKARRHGTGCSRVVHATRYGRGYDLREAKRRIGKRVCMIGGFDQKEYFKGCTTAETRKAVRACFEAAGEGGGFILCPSDHFFDSDLPLLDAFADEARKCVY